MAHMSEFAASPVLASRSTDGRQTLMQWGYVGFGASGAVSTSASDLPPGWSAAETATGVYTLTGPATKRCTVIPAFYDASGGDTYATGKTITLGSTTSVIVSTFGSDGAAEEPTTSDKLHLLILGER